MEVSFRVRLALWNMAVLALVLTGLGLTLAFCDHFGMIHAIDQELADRAARFTDDPRGDGDPFGRSPASAEGRSAVVALVAGTREEREGGVPLPDEPDAEARRAAAFRRPRFLNREGECVGPWRAAGPWDAAVTRPPRRPSYTTVSVAGEKVRVVSAPLVRGGEVVGTVQVARELGEFERIRRVQIQLLFLLIPVVLLVSGAGALFLTDRGLRPVRQVVRAAQEIGAGDLARRLPVTGRDELGQLAATFNGMLARLEAAFEKLETAYRELQEGYERQRRFTADASHELRTPLARIKGSASLALSGVQPAAAHHRALEVVDEAADAMGRLIQDLLLLARSDAGQYRPRSGPLNLHEMLETVRAGCAGAGPEIVLEAVDPALELHGDADCLRRVLVNLVENAVRHTPGDGTITLAARAEGEQVVLSVADTGEGIAPEHLPRIFDRFYRVDDARNRDHGGTGLGLSICKCIVEAHGGRISAHSEPGRGTTVTVTLPRPVASDA